MPMPRRRASSGDLGETSTPSRIIVPDVRVTTPAITLVSVDFPAPFSPTSAWISRALKVKIDTVDRGNAGIELGRLVQGENRVAHAPNSAASGAIGSLKMRPGPFAIMIRSPLNSIADTTPWFVPSTRLCSE